MLRYFLLGVLAGELFILAIIFALPERTESTAAPPILPPRIIASAYALAVEEIAAPFDHGSGGAIDAVDDRILLATRRGTFHVYKAGEEARFDPLDLPLPFSEAEIDDTLHRENIGLRDVIARPDGDWVDVYISFTTYRPGLDCVVMRVATARLGRDDFTLAGPQEWRRFFESNQCVDATAQGYTHEAGGALDFSVDGRLLLAIGSFGMDGAAGKNEERRPQDPDSDIGKVVAIDLTSGVKELVSMGHRNIDGLIVSSTGDIWTVEHGPRGGDELNLIEQGRNYGWPEESYGFGYWSFSLVTDETPGDHAKHSRPFLAWVPSPAVTDIEQISGDEFPRWRDDLLVASLKAGRLDRLRIREGRVVVDEPIWLGARVRDLAIGGEGAIYVKLDTENVVLRLSDANNGSMASDLGFCVGCHSVSPTDAGAGDMTGPPLYGVVGRPVAGADGFSYSSALRDAGGAWTRERLIEFLMDPSAFAPGTTMPSEKLLRAEAEGIVDLLATMK